MSKLLVGRYELVERVGEGGMAVVYKAKDRLLNRFVAVKILRPEFARDDQFVDSFRKESQAAAGLQHPNIVSVYDVGREGDIQFIVMEFIDGMTLSDVIHKTGPMDYKEVVRISKQVASALNVAHQNNIIHRDIKPHNIMMTREGNVKLGDFGIAKAISEATMTETKVIGSVHYFSPEQARGAYVDERSDIYSLGIIMYEMLTGKVPFDGENPVQVALMHINDDIVPPSQVVPGVPPALEKIVMKATDKFQTNRYRNAEELFADLDSIEYVSKMVGEDAFVKESETEPQTPVWQQAPHISRSSNMKHTAPQERIRPPVSRDQDDDDDEEPSVRQKKKSSGKTLVALLIIALLAVAGFYAVQTFGLFDREIVPDVTNMSYSRAEKILAAKGFQVKQGNEIVSNDVDKGKVAAQDPNGGEKAKKGSTVTLDISAGKATGTVPNMIGKYYDDDTHSVIEGYGFKLGDVDYEKSDNFEKNQIMSQTPSANSAAVQGTSIDIVVCSGKKQSEDTARVPSLSGLSANQAKAKLRAAGFSVGTISYDESNVYGAGYVMDQQYDAGTALKKGSSVGFTVSKGKPSENNDKKTDDKKGSDTDPGKTTENTDDQKKTDKDTDTDKKSDSGSGGGDSGGSSGGSGGGDSGGSGGSGGGDSGSGGSGGGDSGGSSGGSSGGDSGSGGSGGNTGGDTTSGDN